MKIAVCCPGQSLPRSWRGLGCADLTIAVNRAMIAIPEADWLSAGDLGTIEDHIPNEIRPRVGVLTYDRNVECVRSMPSWSGKEVLGWGALQLNADHEANDRSMLWSIQAALGLAAHLGGTSIDIYGADGTAGTKREDCTGYACKGTARNFERWAREEIDVAFTIRFLTARGITIRRTYA